MIFSVICRSGTSAASAGVWARHRARRRGALQIPRAPKRQNGTAALIPSNRDVTRTKIAPGDTDNSNLNYFLFSNGLLKGSVYTKPEIFEEMSVPKVLLSGNHKEIEEWRTNNSLKQTFLRRPDLLNNVKLTKKQKKLLEEWASKDIL